ncbi:TcaA 3rd/4th domain-containing protein [Peribacillus butanolivorans]|uniref:TcaA 3rd/4th domain-containing protein n=1 Tax=Peribacillus butanolivorans TaxID=421767 RepID=UPI00364F6BA1
METAKVSKKRKMPVILILLGLFLIGIIATFYMYFTRPSGEEIVNQFEAAVNQGDIDTLEKLVTGNKEMKLTKKNLEQLISYAKDEPSYLKESVFIMKAQAAIEEKDKDAKLQNPIFKMATEGEILQAGDYYISKEDGLFSSFQIYARPYSLTVSSDQADTLIKVNDDEFLETKEGNLETTIQNLPPGIYTVTGSKKYEYAEINTKEEINLFEDDTFSKSVSLELTGEQLAIESDVEDISIFINGKDIGKKATVKEDSIFGGNNEDAELFGPFSTDGSIKVHGEAKFPWGIAKSEPQTIKEDMTSLDVTPKPFADKTNKDQVVQTINDFAKQRIQALVKKDAKIIKTASDNIVKEYAEDIQFAKLNESYWKGEALGTRIDFGNVTLSNENEQYQVKLPVEFNSKEKEYHGFNEDEPLEEESEVTWLILTYNIESKKWIVSEIESNYFDNDVMKGNEVVKTEFK